MRHFIMFVCINAIGALFVLMSVVFQGILQGYPSIILLVIGVLLTILSLPITISSWIITKRDAEVDRFQAKLDTYI